MAQFYRLKDRPDDPVWVYSERGVLNYAFCALPTQTQELILTNSVNGQLAMRWRFVKAFQAAKKSAQTCDRAPLAASMRANGKRPVLLAESVRSSA